MTRYAPQWLQVPTYSASQDRRLIGAIWPAPAASGCAVSVATAMTVNIAAGQVAVPTSNNTGSVLCSSDAVEQVTLAAAPGSGSNRIDLVICQARGNDIDGGANNDFVFSVVTGTAAASPAVPAVPANAVALAQILVPGGSAQVTAANITDRRPAGLPADQTIAARMYPTGQTVIGNGVLSQVLQMTTEYMLGGFTLVNNALVVPVDGIYLCTASCAWQSAGNPVGAGTFQARMAVGGNTARIIGGPVQLTVASNGITGGAAALPLSRGQAVSLYGYQSTGAPAGTFADTSMTWLDLTRIGPRV